MARKRTCVLLATAALAMAQTAQKPLIGTVSGFKVESSEIGIKPDAGDTVYVKFGPETVAARIAPGEKDLKKAEPIKITDIVSGDRVLVSFKPGGSEARRLLVMTAGDIAKRNEADRLDWTKRGIAGVVASKAGNDITLRMRSFTGQITANVTVTDKTTYRRYAPDSVKFSDAKPSNAAEISPGDQLRARGEKSADGSKVTAEEVVFGTFLTSAGTITAINPEAKDVTIAEIGTKKPLTVKVTADSTVKTMPDFKSLLGAGTPGAEGARIGGPPAGGRAGAMGGHSPDIAQMLEHVPASKFEDLKVGDMIVVSSTKGAKSDEVTAITLLSNAGNLIQLASRPAPGASRGGGRGANAGAPSMSGMGGMGGGMGGLDIPGMSP
ncbi:MAG: hypothetical protein ABI165_15335 [Bryobacteraceae bacterium]